MSIGLLAIALHLQILHACATLCPGCRPNKAVFGAGVGHETGCSNEDPHRTHASPKTDAEFYVNHQSAGGDNARTQQKAADVTMSSTWCSKLLSLCMTSSVPYSF
jgi:hypothetical protein